jgi:hypothetical protein
MLTSTLAIPQEPVIPANISPAPAKSGTTKNHGDGNFAEALDVSSIQEMSVGRGRNLI